MKSAREILFLGRKVFEDALKKELRGQGHYLTGAAEGSLTVTLDEAKDKAGIAGEGVFYIGILNDGVKANRIPYGGIGNGAKTSKYIQGLIRFWRLRGLGEKEAVRAAFATAKKHKREGMPTRGSYAFSSNGRRKNNLLALKRASTQVDKIISAAIDAEYQTYFSKIKEETI